MSSTHAQQSQSPTHRATPQSMSSSSSLWDSGDAKSPSSRKNRPNLEEVVDFQGSEWKLSPQARSPSMKRYNTTDRARHASSIPNGPSMTAASQSLASLASTYSLPRPPSRSEHLLRDALRKDEVRVAAAASATNSPDRNGGSPLPTSPGLSPTQYSREHRSTIEKPIVRRGITYAGSTNIDRSFIAGDVRSETPTPRSTHKAPLSPSYFDARLPITPHEAVLRARLERVLMACGECQDIEVEREQSRSRSRSGSPGSDDDSTGRTGWGWSWGGGTSPPTHNDVLRKQHPRSRSQAVPRVHVSSSAGEMALSLPTERASFSSSTPRNALQSTTKPSHTRTLSNGTASTSTGKSPPCSPSAFFRAPSDPTGYGFGMEKKRDGEPEDDEVEVDSRMLTPPPTPPMSPRLLIEEERIRRVSLDGKTIPANPRRAQEANTSMPPPQSPRTNVGSNSKLLVKPMSPIRANTVAVVPTRGNLRRTSTDSSAALLSTSPTSLSLPPLAHPEAIVTSPYPSRAASSSSSPPMTASSTNSSSSRLSKTSSTAPASPKFDAQSASKQCRSIDGYVSFSSIEGLGTPDGMDFDGDEEAEVKKSALKKGFWRVFGS